MSGPEFKSKPIITWPQVHLSEKKHATFVHINFPPMGPRKSGFSVAHIAPNTQAAFKESRNTYLVDLGSPDAKLPRVRIVSTP